MRFIIALFLIALSRAVLINLDHQQVPVADLSSYSFKALIGMALYSFNVQSYKSAGSYYSQIVYKHPAYPSVWYRFYNTPIHGICDPDTGILSVITCDSKKYNFYNCTGASYINGSDPLWSTWAPPQN